MRDALAWTHEQRHPDQVRQLRIRLAFEVPDSARATDERERAGAEVIAPPVQTPWRSLNSRLAAPAGLQITLFQELDSTEATGDAG